MPNRLNLGVRGATHVLWVSWVLYEERDRERRFIHNEPAARRCAWPSRLVLRIDKGEGEFIQFWRVYRESWIGLPGDCER